MNLNATTYTKLLYMVIKPWIEYNPGDFASSFVT